MSRSAGEKWSRKKECGSHRSRLSVDSMKRPWIVFQSTWSNTPRSSAVEWNAQCRTSESEPKNATYIATIASARRPSYRSSNGAILTPRDTCVRRTSLDQHGRARPRQARDRSVRRAVPRLRREVERGLPRLVRGGAQPRQGDGLSRSRALREVGLARHRRQEPLDRW